MSDIVSPELRADLERLPPRQPLRVTVVAVSAPAREEAARALAAAAGAGGRVEERAPCVWDVRLAPERVDDLAGRADLFCRIDRGGRLHGAPIAGAAARVEAAVVLAGDEVPAALAERCGAARERSGVVSVELAPAEIAALVASPLVRSIEVRRAPT